MTPVVQLTRVEIGEKSNSRNGDVSTRELQEDEEDFETNDDDSVVDEPSTIISESVHQINIQANDKSDTKITSVSKVNEPCKNISNNSTLHCLRLKDI